MNKFRIAITNFLVWYTLRVAPSEKDVYLAVVNQQKSIGTAFLTDRYIKILGEHRGFTEVTEVQLLRILSNNRYAVRGGGQVFEINGQWLENFYWYSDGN